MADLSTKRTQRFRDRAKALGWQQVNTWVPTHADKNELLDRAAEMRAAVAKDDTHPR